MKIIDVKEESWDIPLEQIINLLCFHQLICITLHNESERIV